MSINDKDVIIRMLKCNFIDLLDKLERYDFDFVDLSAFKNYIFMAPLNEYKYMIHSVSNNQETYTLHYCQKHKIQNKTINNEANTEEKNNIDDNTIKESNIDDIILANIPYGTFNPTTVYDFEVNLTQKTFKLLNEYVVIDIHDYINNNIDKDNNIKELKNHKKRNRLLHLLGC